LSPSLRVTSISVFCLVSPPPVRVSKPNLYSIGIAAHRSSFHYVRLTSRLLHTLGVGMNIGPL
jgi:hypothetical protein